ncbi:MAG: 2-oxoacid:acceptor oxidoreductase subunit alpha, partial [bacterium]|nr:2-oxoacid:acceptor oxidoreductase subunit alpha [bacterium]
ITETPVTIVDVQRPGPATGLPTWTDQGDLRFALHASQGEFMRLIVAPGDMHECYVGIQVALNLADKFQIPAILLSDKFLSESHMICEQFNVDEIVIDRGKLALNKQAIESGIKFVDENEEYLRYLPTNSGVTLRTVPGVEGGVFLANSDEHDEKGLTNEDASNRQEQSDKRMLKLSNIERELPLPVIYGDVNSSILLIGWGSTKGPILEALKLLEEDLDTSVAFCHAMYIWPFPKDYLNELLPKYRKVILVENNSLGQFGGLIREMTGFHAHHKWLKYDGRPFWPEELKEKIINVIEMKN